MAARGIAIAWDLIQRLFSGLFALFEDLVASLLQLIIFEVEKFFEGERLFRVAVSRERVQDFGQLALADDCILHFANIFIGEDHMCFVDSELEGQEEDWHSDLSALANLYLFQLAEVRVGSGLRATTTLS